MQSFVHIENLLQAKCKKGEALHLKVFEFLLPKDAFYQVWLKLAH